jgi:predicted acetyltransferase
LTITVRTITDTEIEAFTHAMNLGFNHHAGAGEADMRRGGIDVDRTHAAFAGDGTVPGGATVAVGAVTNVAVVPPYRRQGALTQMMAAQLDDVAARGEVAAILIASEAPIYWRFGYGSATRHATVKIETGRTRFLTSPAGRDRLRVVDHATLRTEGPPIYDRYRRAQPGAIDRNDRWWDFACGIKRRSGDDDVEKVFNVVFGDEGYLRYTIKDTWDGRLPASTLALRDLVATTPAAYAALWHHCITLDWIAFVEAGDRPPVEVLPELLTDPRRAVTTNVNDFVWARLLDVPAALSARTYGGRDRLVVEVVDEFRPAQSGRFSLETDGTAACAPTDDPADLTVTARDLGAAWLGDAGLWAPAGAGRVGVHTDGAVARFDNLFVTDPPPWCNTWF